MKESIELEELLDYLNNELSVEDKDKLESFMVENPVYFKVLKGLSDLQEDLGSREKVLQHIKNQDINVLDISAT